MKTKILITLFVIFTFSQVSFGQKIKVKNGIVSVDGKSYVKTEKESGNMSIYALDGDEEIIFFKRHDPTPNNNQNQDDYFIVRFIDYNNDVNISGKTKKGILKMLFNSKVINGDGTINEEKMKKFVSKYI
jgi:hypothetical protein